MAEKENIHKGHRQRMMNRFLRYGIECFEEHEVLEMLLFNSYTRRNTNDIAHALIERFGSLNSVLDAEPEELCQVNGVGQQAAAMLCLLREFARLYAQQDMRGTILVDSEDMRRFCYKLLGGCTVEVAHALYLDDSYALIGESHLSVGSAGAVDFDLKRIVQKAMEYGSTKIIIAHTHPRGVLLASVADVAVTRRIFNTLNGIGLELLDHIIVSEEGAFSMRTARLLPDLWEV